MDVLICGGGVIGASIAYFLSRRGVKAIVFESTGVACAASGKSGGFLARDCRLWHRWRGAALHCMPSWRRSLQGSGAIAGLIPMEGSPGLDGIAGLVRRSGCQMQ